jgi:hypothetical protein
MTARLAPDNQRTADLGFADIIRISPLVLAGGGGLVATLRAKSLAG